MSENQKDWGAFLILLDNHAEQMARNEACSKRVCWVQIIHLRGIDGSVEAGHALCNALARLPELSTVKINDAERNFLLGMAPSIPLLTQIRYILYSPSRLTVCHAFTYSWVGICCKISSTELRRQFWLCFSAISSIRLERVCMGISHWPNICKEKAAELQTSQPY